MKMIELTLTVHVYQKLEGKMEIKKLTLALCKAEGLKKQVNVAQMSEIVGVLCDIIYKLPIRKSICLFIELAHHGMIRHQKRARRK